MKSLKNAATVSLTLLALTKCGGSTQDDTGAVSSGISSSKALSAVTTQDATRGCEQLNDAVAARFSRPSLKTGLCTMSALLLSSSESSCSSARDSCLQDANGDATSSDAALNPAQDFECEDTNLDSWQGCAATVGQMETCLNDMLDAVEALLTSYSCADAGKAQASEACQPPPIDPNGNIAIDPATGKPYAYPSDECEASRATFTSPAIPKSCQALQTQCPNLEMFGGGDDSATN